MTELASSSAVSEPYAKLLLKISKQLVSTGDSRPKTLDRLKNVLDKCYVTRFSAPFKLLEKCRENETIPKVFAFYEELKTKNTWKKSFEKMSTFLQYKFNAFPLELDDSARSKIESRLADWIATRVTSKVVSERDNANLREQFSARCILTGKLDPATLVQVLQQNGYIGISLTGEVTYNLSGVDCGEIDSDKPKSYNEYLVGKLRSVQELPKTEQALINAIKPFTNIIQSVEPSEMLQKYPQLKDILKKLVIREFHLEMEKCFQSSSVEKKGKLPVRGRRGRGRGRPGRGGSRVFGRKRPPDINVNKPLLDVLLKSNKQIEGISSKWNAPLCPQGEEEGVRRVGEWVRNKISAFESGSVSSHHILLQQAMQCSLCRELVPVDTVVDMLQQYGIVRVEGDRVEYDLTNVEGLEAGECEINNYLISDSHMLGGFRRKLGGVRNYETKERGRGKRRGASRSRRGRMKRGKY